MKAVEIFTDGACRGNPDSQYARKGITECWQAKGWETADKLADLGIDDLLEQA